MALYQQQPKVSCFPIPFKPTLTYLDACPTVGLRLTGWTGEQPGEQEDGKFHSLLLVCLGQKLRYFSSSKALSSLWPLRLLLLLLKAA